jgi:hypothetical protein
VEVLSPNCRSFACAAQGLSNASIEVGNLTLWVKRYRWISRLCRPMSVVAPRATIQGASAN